MPRNDDQEDRRTSWRDIDRKKDQSHHIDRSDPYRKNTRGARVDGRSKSYKQALDTFFEGGSLPERFQKLSNVQEKLKQGGGSKRQNALRKLQDAVGRFEVEVAFKEYLEIDPELPRDVNALLAVLEHSDEGLLQRAIELIEELISSKSFPRKELLKQRLRKIEDLAEEPETVEMAESLRRKL